MWKFRRSSKNQRTWFPVDKSFYCTVLLLTASGCSELPGNLPSSPGFDATGIWMPFWLVAAFAVISIPVAFYFGLRKISQPFLKFLFLMYLAFVTVEAGLLWSNGVSIVGQVFGEVPWITRMWSGPMPESADDKEESVNQAAKQSAKENRDNISDNSISASQDNKSEEGQLNFAFQIQLGQAKSELTIVAVIFAILGLFGWRRLHADPETTAVTLVRGKLSIGDLHLGLLNAVRGNFLITWAVRKIQPQHVSVDALKDQKDSLYFLPARLRYPWSFEEKLVNYVKTYARDVEVLINHLEGLATQNNSRAQEALSKLVKEMPANTKHQYEEAISAKLEAKIPTAGGDHDVEQVGP